MSGLLRRLADGAAGRGQPPVRSASRSSFAGAPVLLPEAAAVQGLQPGSLPPSLQPPAAFPRAPAAPAGGTQEARMRVPPLLAPAEQIDERRVRRDSAPVAGQRSGADVQAGHVVPSLREGRPTQQPGAGDVGRPRTPEPLLPPIARVDAPVTGAIRSATITPAATSRLHRADPNGVHVSIGRIEITAVHEAAPPRRAGKAGKPLTSLDDYLRQRQRGG